MSESVAPGPTADRSSQPVPDIGITKSAFYQRRWADGRPLRAIADEYGTTEEALSEWCDAVGARYPARTPQAMVFRLRPKRMLYVAYWAHDKTIAEIAREHDVDTETVQERFESTGVPRHPAGGNGASHWTDGVPSKYQWPTTRATSGSDPAPSDTDPSRYLADPAPYRDKETLYELYWGHGHSITAVAARLDVDSSNVGKYMDELGIPKQEYHAHTDWAPHTGVPPKYEWPDGAPPSTLEDDAESSDFVAGLWRTPDHHAEGAE